MNLFEYISEKFNPSQKTELYQDKAVCLSVFRVAFGSDRDLSSLSGEAGEESKSGDSQASSGT